MPTCLLVYFSMGGTTKKIAEHIASGLESVGFHVDLHSLTSGPPPSPLDYDLFGLGSPTYYFSPPIIVSDYLKTLPRFNLPFFVFILFGSFIGDSGNWIRRHLLAKGGRDVGYFTCRSLDNYYGYLKLGVLANPHLPSFADFERAFHFGQSIASHLADSSYQPAPYDPKISLIYRLERFISRKWFIQHLYYKFFKIDKQRCVRCGICVRTCPMNNISLRPSSFPEFGRNCIACLMCQLKCPHDAISSLIDSKLLRPILRYNTRHLSKIPGVEVARVELKKGKVTLIE